MRKVLAAEDSQVFSSGEGIDAPLSMAEFEALEMEYLKCGRLKTGFQQMDRLLNGLHQGKLYVIGARPSIGKSALGLQIAVNVAAQMKTVIYFSYEMGRREIGERIVASVTGTDVREIHRMSDQAKEAFYVLDALSTLHICNRADLDINGIIDYAKRVKAETGALDLIVVDYLQIIPDAKDAKGKDRYLSLGDATRKLKLFSETEKLPVLALSQMSRQSDEKNPKMSELRESGNIEQDADVIMLLSRPEKGEAAKLLIDKSRYSATGYINMRYKGEFLRFEEVNTP